jgi:hypothetical protein
LQIENFAEFPKDELLRIYQPVEKPLYARSEHPSKTQNPAIAVF